MDVSLFDRRGALRFSVLAAAALLPDASHAGVDPTMTIIEPPDRIAWKPHYGYPDEAVQEAALHGAIGEPGQYFVLVRWHPGFMSAPHFYDSDRLCMVLSGTWYVASGMQFDPDATVPVKAGSFVRRVAKTPHFDGVIKGASEPVVIAISGIGPTRSHPIDPSKPGWRRV